MHIIQKVQRLYTVFHLLWLVIFLAIGFIALNANRQWDLTQHRVHSLSVFSKDVIKQIDAPITVYAFVKNQTNLRQAISRALSPYLRETDKLKLEFKHPDTALGLVKKFGVSTEGTLVFEQGERFTPVIGLTESSLTKGLQAVQRIRPLTIAFAYGHGERHPAHKANFHFADFDSALKEAGLDTISVDMATNDIPDNADVLVIADPRMAYSDKAKSRINRFIEQGKNILILAERESAEYLVDLIDGLPLPVKDGVISNDSGEIYGIQDKHISVIKPSADEAKHPALNDLPSVLLFPNVTVLDEVDKHDDWVFYSMLTHTAGTLMMVDGNASEADNARMAIEATRLRKEVNRDIRQRIILVADADFLSNQYLGNGANREFGVRLVTFLARPAYDLKLQKHATDRYIELTESQKDRLTQVLAIAIPLLLLIIGMIMGRVYQAKYRD